MKMKQDARSRIMHLGRNKVALAATTLNACSSDRSLLAEQNTSCIGPGSFCCCC